MSRKRCVAEEELIRNEKLLVKSMMETLSGEERDFFNATQSTQMEEEYGILDINNAAANQIIRDRVVYNPRISGISMTADGMDFNDWEDDSYLADDEGDRLFDTLEMFGR